MNPKEVNILGKQYQIKYVNRPIDVDPKGYQALWGQINFFDREIVVYDNGKPEDVFETLIHEIIHGIEELLKIRVFEDEAGHEALSLLAVALADVLTRNQWVVLGEEEEYETSEQSESDGGNEV